MDPRSASPSGGWLLACLCAAWCGTCREYRAVFDALGADPAHADVRFLWIDVEDDAELLGPVDVENFPTLLIGDAAGARFFGPLPPRAEQTARLLAALKADNSARPLDEELHELLSRLHRLPAPG
ncbi:MAG: thioredoxin domain-containing protein [Burkholderiaceae bacterium]